MKLLVLGGTVFLGRSIVEAAIAAGHEVTLFNRGQTQAGLFPDLEQLRGDRDRAELSALAGRTWDAAIDTSTLLPQTARATAAALAESVGHYTYISSFSVYENLSIVGITESDTLRSPQIEDHSGAIASGDQFGSLKAACEQIFEAAWGDRLLTVRPGLLVGPWDPTDRFTYWVWRLAQGGPVLLPNPADRAVQWLDVRDLADWILAAIAIDRTGVYNTASPEQALTFGRAIGTIQTVMARLDQPASELIWVDEAFLLDAGVTPWLDLPWWIPQSERAYRALMRLDTRKAARDGLICRPLASTIADIFAWLNPEAGDRPLGDRPLKAGLSRDREVELLTAWRKILKSC